MIKTFEEGEMLLALLGINGESSFVGLNEAR